MYPRELNLDRVLLHPGAGRLDRLLQPTRMKPTSFPLATLLGLFLALLLTTGCPPKPTESACDQDIPLLDYTERSCQSQRIGLVYDPAAEKPAAELDLPSDCATEGMAPSRIFRLPNNRTGTLTLQQYLAEPIRTLVEVFSGSCDSTLTFVGCEKLEGLVAEWSLAVPGRYPLVVRVTPLEVTGEKTTPDEPRREISFVAYDGKSNSAGCPQDDGLPRRVLVAVSGNQVALADVAGELGLSIAETCDCAAPYQLAAFNLPDNVDLNEIGGKLKTKTNTKIDTVQYDLEPIIRFESDEKYAPLLEEFGNFIGEQGGYAEPGNLFGGKRMKIAIIDTGVDPTGHPIFANVAWKLNRPGDACFGDFSDLGYDFADQDPVPNDVVDHGTGVAGAVINQWPEDLRLEMAHLKFYGTEGRLFDGLCALHAAARAEADVINLSWGVYQPELPGAMYQALRHAQEQGAAVVTSAGNEQRDIGVTPQWPAAAAQLPHLVTVGAYLVDNNPNPTLTNFSNYNKQRVKVAGAFALETLKAGGGTAFKAGTSIAAPFVTAHLAAFRANQGRDPVGLVIQNFLQAQPVSTALPDSVRNGKFVPF